MMNYIERWIKWQKRCINGPFYKFLVLTGFIKSPSMTLMLTDKEEQEIHYTVENILKER